MIEQENNGIVNKSNGEKYTFWTRADYIKDKYIEPYLKEKFQNKLVIRELNQVDFCIPDDNLPIEVQATPIHRDGDICTPHYSGFETEIEKQIKQNITSHGICWFFFDSELLRAMNDAINKRSTISINMDWLRKFMKEGKLKVFTVSHDGIIEEKEYKDFDFLSLISQTCAIAADTDDMILNKNKMRIFLNVVRGCGITQIDIDKWQKDWAHHDQEYYNRKTEFFRKHKDEKAKLYGKILEGISNLSAINDILDLKNYDYKSRRATYLASVLGIFYVEFASMNSCRTFINKYNICQYFPGYIRNKETWDKLKGHNLNPRQFESIIKNGINNYFWYEEDKNMITESEQIDDKGVNVTIESKDQIITVNIKDNTKQGNIEDTWIKK